MNSATILWYDLETFGLHPPSARIAQIATQRTDLDLNPVGEENSVLVKLADDWLADPVSCAITGITPQYCNQHGQTEAEALHWLYGEMTRPGTIVAGYNNSHFDDTVVRFSNYRNGLDPYPISARYRSRLWDFLNVLRLAYGSAVEGIKWPLNEEGETSFRLGAIARANAVAHDQMHDATWDVRATIALAALLKAADESLFATMIAQAGDYPLARTLNYQMSEALFTHPPEPLLWASPHACNEHRRCFVVLPLIGSPAMKKQIICWHLRQDPEILEPLSAEDIHQRLFSPSTELLERGMERIQAPCLRLNKAPAFVPALPLLEQEGVEERLGITLETIYSHLEKWEANREKWLPKLMAAYSQRSFQSTGVLDADRALYAHLIGDHDRREFERGHASGWEQAARQKRSFNLPHLHKIWARTRARNGHAFLSPEEQRQWKRFVCRQLRSDEPGRTSWQQFPARCDEALQRFPDSQDTIAALWRYYAALGAKYRLA